MTDFTIHDWREAVLDGDLISSAKLVALTLSMFYRESKETYPSLTTLEAKTSLSRPTVCSCLELLEEKGFIKKSKRKVSSLSFVSNSYNFVGVEGSKIASQDTSKNDSKDASKITSKTILPEYREEENIEKKKEKSKKEKISSLEDFEAWDYKTDPTFQKWFKGKKENTDFAKNSFLTDHFVEKQKEAVVLYCKSKGKKYKDYVATLQGFINTEIEKRGA